MTPRSNSAAPRAPLHFLGLACAIGVSTIYFNQPLLVEMGKTYGAPAGRVMYVASATQVGYALGLLFFVPLGDLLERRALMMRMYAAVVVALLLVSLAPTLAWLIAGSVLLGVVASVTHIVLPIAPDLVPHKERGRAIGTVMMGLLLGSSAGADLRRMDQPHPGALRLRAAPLSQRGLLGHRRLALCLYHRRAGAMRRFFFCSAA